jgi:hypothetical protein
MTWDEQSGRYNGKQTDYELSTHSDNILMATLGNL